jgi:AcrR family transcriptional regulator
MAQLTRDEILDAAVELVDSGPAGLTMRALGDRLGVTGAALYYWFPAKDDLLEAVAGHLAARIVAESDPRTGWQEQLRAIATGVTRAAAEHPRAFSWVFTTYAKRPPLAQVDEAILEVLMSGGFAGREALLGKGLFWRFIVGHLSLTALPAHIDPEIVDIDHHPRIHEVAAVSAALAAMDYFDYGLDQLIASLAASDVGDTAARRTDPADASGEQRGLDRRARHS